MSSVDEIPNDFVPQPIGRRSEIIAKIKDVIPTADFTGPSWGIIDGDDWSIEINVGGEEKCNSFALHVRGADAAIGAVAAILEQLGLRGLDPQSSATGFFAADEEAIKSFARWRAYRDRAVR